MDLRPLVARALKVLPAVVIVVAGLFQARSSHELARAKPADAISLLARADVRPHDRPRGRALEAAGTRSRRELDARDLAGRVLR